MSFFSSQFRNIFFTNLLFAFLFLNSSLYSDDIKWNIGLWSGKYKSELQDRFKNDDLLDGAPDGIYRFDQNWKNTKSFLYPLGAVYTRQIKSWTTVFRGNYFHRSMQSEYNAFDSNGNYSNTKLVGGYSSDYEVDAGIKKGFFNNKLFLVPRIGFRSHVKGFNASEHTFGVNTLFTTTNGNYASYSNHLYYGIDIQYFFRKKYSLILDLVLPMPKPLELISYLGDMGSKASYDFDRAGIYTNRFYIETNDIHSRYTYQLTRIALGIQYDISEKFSVQLGYRQETTKVSYDSYHNTPLRIANGGTFENFSADPALQYLVLEDYLDKSLYKDSKTSTQRGIYLTGTYRMELKQKAKPE